MAPGLGVAMTRAADMSLRSTTQAVSIPASDGDCPALVFRPAGKAPWPAAIFLMDGFGMRQTLVDMAQRLSDGGYFVLLPDLFYRRGPYEPLDVPGIFARGRLREEVGELLGPSPDNRMAAADAAAFIDCLDAHPDTDGLKIGVTGYCMSGAMALAIAGTYPDQVAAAACFHPGPIILDMETSLHHLAVHEREDLRGGCGDGSLFAAADDPRV